MQFLSDTRGTSTTVTYTLIVVFVIATAGGGITAVQGLQDISESQIESQEFVVEEYSDYGAHYRLVYTGSEVLTYKNIDVLEVSGDSKKILTTPDAWSGNNLSRGDTVIEDLTPNGLRNSDFSDGEKLDIIKYSNAEINNGSVVGAEQPQLLQTVALRGPDPGDIVEPRLYNGTDDDEEDGDDDPVIIIE